MKKSASNYKPPYTLSEKAVSLIAEIAAALERYKIVMEGPDGVWLRKINHVKTIRGTTAIEGNTLTEEQVTAVLDGKRVAAPRREIDEIKGAHAAYELLEKVNPYSLKDMLRVHAMMMKGLVDGAGALRTRGVGVVDGLGNVLHMAPPAGRVPQLVGDLLDWAAASTAHPLVKSCVLHYEFEFIHPFLDGNGRMGRFLQTAMLGKWNELFYAAPVENIVFSNQEKYYQAINESTARAECGPFIDFMLERILETIRTKGVLADVPINVPMNVPINEAVLDLVRKNPGISRTKMAALLSVNVKTIGRALSALSQIEHRGSKRTGGYFVKESSKRSGK